jgi:limonene-1,2-epoxide hydrolase
MPQAARVDVAEALEVSLADVLTQARDKHAADLATYREGVRGMAEAGGTLPPDQAERLLAAARNLGIPPARLAADATTMLRHSRHAAAIEAAMQRNAKQGQLVAEAKAKLDAETPLFVQVRVECMGKMKAAEARLNELQRDYSKAQAVRHERVDEQQSSMVQLENAAPHLFRDIEPEMLRRLLAPQ